MAGLMGLDWRKQKDLLKLRSKLSFRQFMGEKAKILSSIIAIAILTPVTIGFAAATGAGYLFLPDQWPYQLLGFVFLLSWLIWIVAPVFSFNVNEGLDPTRLLIYPISRRDFLAHMLLGTLLDYPTYFLAPFAIAVVVGFGLGLALPIVLIAIFLCYLLLVLTSQTLINTLGGVLRSRRFRDISVIVGAFIGFSCWFVSTGLQGVFSRLADVSEQDAETFFQTWQPLDIMKWLPPGAAAKAVEQASTGHWGGSFLWLGYTLVWVVFFGWLWWQVTHRIITGEGFVIGGLPTPSKEKEVKQKEKSKGLRGLSWDWIPADIRQVAVKEVRIRWRTPQSRIGLIYMFLMPFFFVAYPLFFDPDRSNSPISISKYVFVGGVAVYTMFVFWTNGQNMLGWETNGLPTLFLTPVSRQRLFIGKGLAQFLMNGIPVVIISIVAVVVQPSLVSVALLPNGIAQGLAVLSVMSVSSVLFPYPVRTDKQSGQNPFAGKGGCITGLANMTVIPMAVGLVSLPVFAPVGLALLLGWDWLALVGLVFTLPYGAALFWFGTRLAGQLVVDREPEILIATRFKGERES
ncbi:MAG: hypothetical protein WAM60_15015 [Candidatus Promineifilaceae bacterium]